MKLLKYLSFSAVLLIALGLSSCANVEDAEKYADKFYEAMKGEDYDAVKGLLDESMLENNSMEEISNLIVQKEALGEMSSFKKEVDAVKQDANGITVVRFLYEVKYPEVTLYEYIRLTKRGEEYRVVNYGYYDNKEKRQEFIDHLEG
jgi:hypothetical protein